ncbi:MAG: asparaginase domain-containing protein, partial [Pseudomonadota bacterium]
MARLGFLYAGGTIGCRGQPLAPVSGEEMHKAWATTEELPQPAQWLALDPAIDSSEATPTDWVRLMRGVLTLAERCDGVVVLHGTDTLAWSAAMLAYLSTLIGSDGVPMARLACPVVVTGAQRPLFDDDASLRAGSDAPANLTLAAAVAARPIPGCRVAFGGQIMAATRIVKV